MLLEWKRWQSNMKVLSEADKHMHRDNGQNQGFYSSFPVPEIREPWRWFKQFMFTLSCLNSIAS